MRSKVAGNCLWVLLNVALLFGSLNNNPVLLNLADGLIWVTIALAWVGLAIMVMLIGCVSNGMDDQSIKAYDSLTKMVASQRKRGKLGKELGTAQMLITVASISIAGWTLTAVLYFITSLLLRLAYNVAISKLNDIDGAKAG